MTKLSLKKTMEYFNKKYETIQQLQSLVVRKDYQMIEADLLESYDKFKTRHQRVDKNSMVKLIDKEGDVKVLRPDVTTSIIDNLAMKWENTPLKVFYNETIFVNKADGINEEKQFGVEYLGENSQAADQEILTIIKEIFESFDLEFLIEINDASIIDTIFDSLNLEERQITKLKEILDNKDISRLETFIDKYLSDYPYQSFLKSILDLQGSFEVVSKKLKTLDVPKDVMDKVEGLKIFEETLGKHNAVIDLSMQSVYGYYQGIIFKGYMSNLSRNVLSGGRYNTKALGTEQSIDACGFSLTLNELLEKKVA